MQNILQTARELTKNSIITVFGCGGDRDKTKRPAMGQIAGDYSNFTIITSDNPRSEDPLKICAEIEKGLLKSKQLGKYIIIPDRYEAIKYALNMCKKGDLVLIAGKGHETGQVIGNKVLPFDDREVVKKFLDTGLLKKIQK